MVWVYLGTDKISCVGGIRRAIIALQVGGWEITAKTGVVQIRKAGILLCS